MIRFYLRDLKTAIEIPIPEGKTPEWSAITIRNMMTGKGIVNFGGLVIESDQILYVRADAS